MVDEPETDPAQEPAPEEPELPQFILEGARSSRSRCKLCRKKIDKGMLRLGTLIEGPFGTGHIWEHLTCAARRSFDKVEKAYADRAWENAKVAPEEWPELDELRKLKEVAEKKRAERRDPPYVELAPSSRSRCKHSGEAIEQGTARVVLTREVTFGNQTRNTPINVLPEHVAAALRESDSGTAPEGFIEALEANTTDLDTEVLREVIERIGSI